MKAVDTNVLVRLLTGDDPAQAAVAAAELREGPIRLSSTVLMETEWVLRYAYKYGREEVSAALVGVVNLSGATVDDDSAVRTALRWHAAGMDFADALHLARQDEADEFITFDRDLARKALQQQVTPHVRLLE